MRGPRAFSRGLYVVETCRCSLAMRLAAVSRANRGTFNSGLLGVSGVIGIGVSAPPLVLRLVVELPIWLCPSLLLRDLGAPRPTGCLMNLLSALADVGRSSKMSSSLPSPKLRRRVGFVMVFLAAAASSAGVRLPRTVPPRPGVSGRYASLECDLMPARLPSLEPSESFRR